MRWLPLCFFMLFCIACNNQANQDSPINIHLGKDSQSIVISGLDYATLQELKKDSLSLENFQSLFPVHRIPADTDMADLQPEQPGTYLVTDSILTFSPDTAFKKHQQYFARFYGNGTNFTSSNLIRSKTNLKGQNFTQRVFKF